MDIFKRISNARAFHLMMMRQVRKGDTRAQAGTQPVLEPESRSIAKETPKKLSSFPAMRANKK